MEGDKIRFRIPQNIMPRYGADDETRYGRKVSWPVNININVNVSSIYLGTKFLSHKGEWKITKDENDSSHVEYELSIPQWHHVENDIVLLITQQNSRKTHCIVERNLNLKSECLKLSFFRAPNLAVIGGGGGGGQQNSHSELIFLLDKSGSMAGSAWNAVVSCMSLFLRSIPQNSLFNIICFDNRHDLCFRESKKYTQSNMKVCFF